MLQKQNTVKEKTLHNFRINQGNNMLSDERYKELMNQVGMPDSTQLLLALQQAVQEATIQENKACVTACSKVKDYYLAHHIDNNRMLGYLVAAADDCIHAIGTLHVGE